MSVFEVQNVAVSYRRKKILSDLSFSVSSGSVTALLGRNGCGKTTLLNAAAGNLAYQGSICVDGCEIRSMKPSARAQLVSLMPQLLPAPDVTVRELVLFGRMPYMGFSGIASADDRVAAAEALRKTGMEEFAEKMVSNLSGGERQKAFFALLLAQNAPVVLLDEPTAHLDAPGRRALYGFVRAMREGGKSVVLVLHELSEALTLADKICLIDKGQTAFSGTPDDFLAAGCAERYFGLRPVSVRDGNLTRLFFCDAEQGIK